MRDARPEGAPRARSTNFLRKGQEILKLYEQLYGPYPYRELAHRPDGLPCLGFAQAPQGFVQLTGEAFHVAVRVGTHDNIHGLFAHEIAHQWWGHKVGWASPNDEWLSESFAEYASGIFIKAYQGAEEVPAHPGGMAHGSQA